MALLALLLGLNSAVRAATGGAAAPKAVSAQKAVAVNALKGRGVSSDLAALLSDILRTELTATRSFQVMNREDMSSVMNEVKLAAMGACSGRNCLVDTGKALGVAKMIGGSIGKLGSKYVVTVKLVDLNTTRNEMQFTEYYQGPEDGLDKVIKNVALRLAGKRKVVSTAPVLAKYPPAGMVLVPADSKIVSADGKVMILASEADSKGRSAKAGSVLAQGSLLSTGPKARARVQLPNGSLLDLKPQTTLALKTSEKSSQGDVSWTRVKVVTGGLLARVKKLTSRKSGFEIQSGEAVCGVRGTIVGAGDQGDFQNFTGDIVVDEGGETTEVGEGMEYDDYDVNPIGDEDYSGWGDLPSQGVNGGESAQNPGDGSGSAGDQGSSSNETTGPSDASVPPPADESGVVSDEGAEGDLLQTGDDIQTDIGGEVIDQFQTIQNGTIEMDITFTESSSGG